MLLQQRHQKVDGQMNVLDQLVFGHGHVTDGYAQAENLKDVS